MLQVFQIILSVQKINFVFLIYFSSSCKEMLHFSPCLYNLCRHYVENYQRKLGCYSIDLGKIFRFQKIFMIILHMTSSVLILAILQQSVSFSCTLQTGFIRCWVHLIFLAHLPYWYLSPRMYTFGLW